MKSARNIMIAGLGWMLVTAVTVFGGATAAQAASSPVIGGGGWAGSGSGSHATAHGAAISPALRSAPSGYPRGIDVSSNDHTCLGCIPPDWPSEAASGLSFAYVKATEGTTYTNPYFDSDYQGAKNNGIYAGAYAWGRPDLGNPIGQADYFYSHMGWTRDGKTLPPFVDMEWPWFSGVNSCYNQSPSQMTTWLHSFLSELQALTGVTPMIYTNVNWWNPCTGSDSSFGNYLLDISSCNSSPPPVPGWSRWTIWQYDIDACGDGPPNDLDVFNGTLADLGALASAVNAPADKLAFIKNMNTDSGTIEVHQAASPYQSHDSSTSSFSAAERFNGGFSMVGDKLVFIKTRNTDSNRIELHWRTAASGYQSGYDTPTSFQLSDASNGVFSLVGTDLVFIKTSNTGSGMVEVHKVSSANDYQNPPFLSVATPISTADATNGTFVMYGNDLVFIKQYNTGYGKVEVHILDGSCNFCQWKEHQVSLFNTSDSINGRWTYADTVGNDGVGDLVFIKLWNTDTHTVELFAASGTAGYQQLSLATSTVFTPADNANGLYGMNF